MTTTVTIGIQGNKVCEVARSDLPGQNVLPGQFITIGVHGEQTISVKEIGDFLPHGRLQHVPFETTQRDDHHPTAAGYKAQAEGLATSGYIKTLG